MEMYSIENWKVVWLYIALIKRPWKLVRAYTGKKMGDH